MEDMLSHLLRGFLDVVRAHPKQEAILDAFLEYVVRPGGVAQAGSLYVHRRRDDKDLLIPFIYEGSEGKQAEVTRWGPEVGRVFCAEAPGLAWEAWHRRRTLTQNNVAQPLEGGEGFTSTPEDPVAVANIVSVPIVFAPSMWEDEPFGVASFHNDDPNLPFGDDDRVAMEMCVAVLGLALASAVRPLPADWAVAKEGAEAEVRAKPEERKAKIFLSHKTGDDKLARVIKDQLEGLSVSDRIEVAIFEESAAGRPWGDWIDQELRTSDLLILLFTDPSDEWDWCMYEAGLFTPLDRELRRPVICLYPEGGSPPNPFRGLTGVPATKADIVDKLLEPLFKTTDLVDVGEVLEPDLAKSKAREAADRIQMEMREAAYPDRHYFVDRMRLDLRTVASPDADQDLEEVAVELSRGTGGTVFDVIEGSWTWRDLKKALTRGNSPPAWMTEIESNVKDMLGKHHPRMLKSTIVRDGGDTYRPCIYLARKARDKLGYLYVLFAPCLAQAAAE